MGQQDWGWVDVGASSNRAMWGMSTRTKTHLGGRDTSLWLLEVLRASLSDGSWRFLIIRM